MMLTKWSTQELTLTSLDGPPRSHLLNWLDDRLAYWAAGSGTTHAKDTRASLSRGGVVEVVSTGRPTVQPSCARDRGFEVTEPPLFPATMKRLLWVRECHVPDPQTAGDRAPLVGTKGGTAIVVAPDAARWR